MITIITHIFLLRNELSKKNSMLTKMIKWVAFLRKNTK